MNVNIANTLKLLVPEIQAVAEVLGLPALSDDATVKQRENQIAECLGFLNLQACAEGD